MGTRVEIEHRAATPVGGVIEVHAAQSFVDGRLVRFTVAAREVVDGALAKVVGTGEVTRVIVDAERFLSRL